MDDCQKNSQENVTAHHDDNNDDFTQRDRLDSWIKDPRAR